MYNGFYTELNAIADWLSIFFLASSPFVWLFVSVYVCVCMRKSQFEIAWFSKLDFSFFLYTHYTKAEKVSSFVDFVVPVDS